MRFDINRMATLAGLKSSSSGLLRESKEEVSEAYLDEEDMSVGAVDEEKDEEDDANEMVEIDETMLVQELRRMKRIMNEAKKKTVLKKKRRKENLQEAQLKALIDAEVKHVLKDLGMAGSESTWMYGNRRPTKSKKGYVHQGSFLKGIGFK